MTKPHVFYINIDEWMRGDIIPKLSDEALRALTLLIVYMGNQEQRIIDDVILISRLIDRPIQCWRILSLELVKADGALEKRGRFLFLSKKLWRPGFS